MQIFSPIFFIKYCGNTVDVKMQILFEICVLIISGSDSEKKIVKVGQKK